MWVLEVWQRSMQQWSVLREGSEDECRKWLSWYADNRPEILSQLNVREVSEDSPGPPPPFILSGFETGDQEDA